MRYEEHRSAARAGPFVECFWLARDDDARTPTADPRRSRRARRLPRVDLPPGLRRTGASRADGTAEDQPASFVVGLTTRPLRLAPTGRVATLGVRFRPGRRAPSCSRLPLEELTDRAVRDRRALGRAGPPRCEEEVGECAGRPDAARAILERFLLQPPRRASFRTARLDAAVDRHPASPRPRLRVAELAPLAWLEPAPARARIPAPGRPASRRRCRGSRASRTSCASPAARPNGPGPSSPPQPATPTRRT